MAWRFRRSFKLVPGVRLNITKRGVSSLSIGGRGARLNLGKRGVKQTLGIPGTGLSLSALSSTPARARTLKRGSATHVVTSLSVPEIETGRFGIAPRPVSSVRTVTKGAALVAGMVLAIASFSLPSPWGWIAVAALLLGVILPSRKKLEATERQRCQELAKIEVGQRLAQFRQATDSATTTGSSARALLALQERLGLDDDEIGRDTIATLHGITALSEYEQAVSANGDQLPTLEGHEGIVTSEACYFVSSATYDKRGDNDPTGSVYLSNEQLVFVAPEGLTTAPWTKVISVDCDGSVLRVQRRDRKTPYLFDLPSVGDALMANFIGRRILSKVIQPTASDDHNGAPEARSNSLETTGDRISASTAKRSVSTTRRIDLGTGEGFTLGIVGESYRQTALRTLAGDRRRLGEEVFFVAVLSAEPDNSYDSNAIRVDIDGADQIGYLSREDAVAYRNVLSAVSTQNAVAICRAKLIGGTPGKPSIGAMLDLRSPNEILATLSNAQPF